LRPACRLHGPLLGIFLLGIVQILAPAKCLLPWVPYFVWQILISIAVRPGVVLTGCRQFLLAMMLHAGELDRPLVAVCWHHVHEQFA
jgi:hypothetical protein